jgi:hypothetical protein
LVNTDIVDVSFLQWIWPLLKHDARALVVELTSKHLGIFRLVVGSLQEPKHLVNDISLQVYLQVKRGQVQWQDVQGDQIVCC